MAEHRRELTIVNSRGLHARASAKFVNAASQLPEGVCVTVTKGANSAAGGSILGLMMLGAARGDTIELVVTGDADGTVIERLSALVADGFGEE
ncbi:MAG: HPr family phosphocarrier protein [Erythrobacter sp. 34-65-8]|nr:MAG: HPr family phosphocarrier protein [Erythrobacter sp. 34-65-8]